MGPRFASYFICTSPRSGSTLLCGLLGATGVAGRPRSHFHEPSLDGWLDAYGLAGRAFRTQPEALRAVFDAARNCGTGGTNLFGLRMQQGSFPYFTEQVAVLRPGLRSDAAGIEAEFGPTLFVHLTRPDKLDQAISRVRAEQTGLWHRNADGSELERLSPPAEPHYDPGAIARHRDDLAAQDAAWTAWFEDEGIDPLRIRYDDLAGDPRGTLARVLTALGFDPETAGSVQPPTAKLADTVSRDWRRRFEAEAHEGLNKTTGRTKST